MPFKIALKLEAFQLARGRVQRDWAQAGLCTAGTERSSGPGTDCRIESPYEGVQSTAVGKTGPAL